MIKKTLFVLLAMSLMMAACAPVVKTSETMMDKPTEAMMDKPTEAMMEKPTEEMMPQDTAATPDTMEDAMMETPAWFTAELLNVSSGETYTIHDLKGKVVLVETLAIWCSNCKKQQGQVKLLHEMLGMNKDLVSIGLDIDPNENSEDLKSYIDQNGFDWVYSVASAEVANEIGKLYGDQFLNPPSTPILVIDRKGQVHPMPFGIKSAEELKEFLEPFLAESM